MATKKPATKKKAAAKKKAPAKKAAPKKKAPAKKATPKKAVPKKKAAAKKPASKKAPARKRTPARKKVPVAPSPVDGHFKGKPASLRRIYNVLVKELEKFGTFRADAVKTSINLIHRYHFGSVTVQDEALRLGFVSDVRARSERIVQTQELGPERVGHSVRLESTKDVDAELLGWLRRAYELQG